MAVSLSTFNTVEQKLDQLEHSPTPNPEPTPATPIVSANTEPTPAPVSAEPIPEPEANNSEFTLSIGDEPTPSADPVLTPQPATYNWKEELKKIPIDEVATELGFDPFAVELNKHIKGGGQPLDYLQARAIDYNKLSDDALVKSDLRTQYPNLTPQQIDLMFNKRYTVSETAEDDEKELATINLQADAYKIRQNKIAEQQRFKISETPTPQKDEAYEQWKQHREQQSQRNETISNFYVNHSATKALNESKKVTLNLGEDVAPFNFVVDKPEMLTKPFTDDGTIWNKLTSTPQGEPDVAKQQLIALFSYNPQKFIQDVFKYGIQMGERKPVKEGQNAQKPQAIVTNMPNSERPVVTGTGTYGAKARQ